MYKYKILLTLLVMILSVSTVFAASGTAVVGYEGDCGFLGLKCIFGNMFTVLYNFRSVVPDSSSECLAYNRACYTNYYRDNCKWTGTDPRYSPQSVCLCDWHDEDETLYQTECGTWDAATITTKTPTGVTITSDQTYNSGTGIIYNTPKTVGSTFESSGVADVTTLSGSSTTSTTSSATNIKVEDILIPPSGNFGEKINVIVTLSNSGQEGETNMEVGVYTLEWAKKNNLAGTLAAAFTETQTCGADEEFVRAGKIKMGTGTTTVPLTITLPSSNSKLTDGTSNYDVNGQYVILSGTYKACGESYTGFVSKGFNIKSGTALVGGLTGGTGVGFVGFLKDIFGSLWYVALIIIFMLLAVIIYYTYKKIIK